MPFAQDGRPGEGWLLINASPDLPQQIRSTRALQPTQAGDTPIHAVVRALGWPILMIEGIEADDLLASYATAFRANGDDVIIAGSVTDEDAKKQYPQGWKAPKPYIRIVPQPKA